MSSKQHSLQDLQENYEGAISVLNKYHTKMFSIIDAQVAQKLVKEFEEKALGVLVKVSESATKVADRKQSKQQDISSVSSREKEDFSHGYGNAVAKRIDSEHEGFLSMEEMLDEVIRLEAEMLSRGSIRIPVRIFSPKTSGSMVVGNGGGMEEAKTAPKYESLVRVLAKRSIDISGLMVGVETLEKSQMRSVPYRVIWMTNPIRTICISDEVGEKTYVYHGFVDIASLAAHEKGESIRGISVVGVTYSDAYETGLERAVFDDNVSFMEDSPVIRDISSLVPPITPEFVPNAEILAYQSVLITHEKALTEAGIVQQDGIWYFGDAKAVKSWPKINGKNLKSFPNGVFNKARGIGDENGAIQNPEVLKKMFRVLGLAVATGEQELERQEERENQILFPQWRKELENAEEALAEVAIIQENGIWYFGDAKEVKSWPDIQGRNLKSFPNRAFNKALGIGDKNGLFQNPEALKIMFRALGLVVASDEQEWARWGMLLQNAEEAFAEAGIIQENGIWYFGDAKGSRIWPDIQGRNLKSFPNGGFNKARGIGDKDGQIRKPEELKKIFRALGLAVATGEQELVRKKRR